MKASCSWWARVGVGVTSGMGVFVPTVAHATYSVIAVDTESGEMGGFAVSCIGDELPLSEVIVTREGLGMIAAQGYFYPEGRDALIHELERGGSPNGAIVRALSPAIDPTGGSSGPAYRQYAVIDVTGALGLHSGNRLDSLSGHRGGSRDSIVFSAQGNSITGVEVLDALEAGFLSAEPGLAPGLLTALRAVPAAGVGDSRCAPLSGDAGYFAYAKPGEELIEVEQLSDVVEVALLVADEAEKTIPPPDEEAQGSGAGNDANGGCSWRPDSRGHAPFPAGFVVLAWGLLLALARRASAYLKRRAI